MEEKQKTPGSYSLMASEFFWTKNRFRYMSNQHALFITHCSIGFLVAIALVAYRTALLVLTHMLASLEYLSVTCIKADACRNHPFCKPCENIALHVIIAPTTL